MSKAADVAGSVEAAADSPFKPVGESSRFFTVDMHTHILPKTWPDLKEKYGYGGFIRLEHHKPHCARMLQDDKLFREIEDNCWSAERRMQEADIQGVNVQVLSTVPVMFSYWAKPEDCLDLAMYLNDHIAQVVAEHPKRFVGLGTLPMQAPDLAVRELHRCVTELGLAGVQIGSHVNDWNLGDPELFPVFQAAEELGACIFVHPWDMLGKNRMEKYWLPWLVGMPAETSLAICSLIFGGVLEKLPRLRIGFAHGGGAFPATVGRIEHGHKVRPDLCAVDCKTNPRDFCKRIWLDSLVHDPNVLKLVVDLVGEERVMCGSDYPFPLGEEMPGLLIRESEYDDAAKAKMLGDNAMHFLGVDKSRFV